MCDLEKRVEWLEMQMRLVHRTLDKMADRKTEPQTYVINPQEPTNDDKCFECDDFFTCGGQCNKIEDEPQTETHDIRTDTHECVKDTHDKPEPLECVTCKHGAWHTPKTCSKCVRQEDGKPSMYEPKTKPQTERSE